MTTKLCVATIYICGIFSGVMITVLWVAYAYAKGWLK